MPHAPRVHRPHGWKAHKPYANSRTAAKRLSGRALQVRNARIQLRDGYTCRVCSLVTVHGEVDHVIPLSRGGVDHDENCAWTCIPCHRDKTLRERGRAGS